MPIKKMRNNMEANPTTALDWKIKAQTLLKLNRKL